MAEPGLKPNKKSRQSQALLEPTACIYNFVLLSQEPKEWLLLSFDYE